MTPDEVLRLWIDRWGLFILFICAFIMFILGIWTRDTRWVWTGVVFIGAIAVLRW